MPSGVLWLAIAGAGFLFGAYGIAAGRSASVGGIFLIGSCLLGYFGWTQHTAYRKAKREFEAASSRP